MTGNKTSVSIRKQHVLKYVQETAFKNSFTWGIIYKPALKYA